MIRRMLRRTTLGEEPKSYLPVRLRAGRFCAWMLVAAAALLALDAFRYVYLFHTSHPYGYRFVDRLGLNAEMGPAAWLSSLWLLGASLLSALIARTLRRRGVSRRKVASWGVMSIALLYVSMDEIMAIHENLSLVVDRALPALHTEGFLLFAWVVVGVPATLILAVLSLPALSTLPRGLRWRLVLAGAVYCAGALGMEMLGGLAFDAAGRESFVWNLCVAVEETCEMLGLILALYVLITFLNRLVLEASGGEAIVSAGRTGSPGERENHASRSIASPWASS